MCKMDSPTRMVDIYQIQNLINGKQYIGQAVREFANGKKHGAMGRWKQHCIVTEHTKNHVLSRSIQKYGPGSFRVEVITTVEQTLADDYECMMIDLYDTLTPKGMNITSGGSGVKMEKSSDTIRKTYKTQWPDKELPMNICYRKVGNNEGYMVQKIGYGNSKAFMSMKQNMEEKLNMAKAYLATLTERREKTSRDLPKHITRVRGRDGRTFLKIEIKRQKKVVFWKSFCKGKESEQLERANKCIEELQELGLVKRGG